MRARLFRRTAVLVSVFCLSTAGAHAQRIADDDWLERCREERAGRSEQERFCEVREIPLDADGSLTVDGRRNGGISVEGWDRDEVLVRARISATAETEARARADAEAIRIRTDRGTVRAEGPDGDRNSWWSVSYQVFVPHDYDLSLRANNGGIRIADVEGRIDAETNNGGMDLRGLAGDVRGRTTNGGVNVRLDGDGWEGEGLDVETTNGGVTLQLPRGYSAQLETGTVNGRVETDFPITVQGRLDRDVRTRLGNGGATIRAVTTNGSIRIQERGSR